MTKYTDYDIVFQEIPGETTLAVNISNCPHRCPGCHSPQLQTDIGEELTPEVLSALIKKYSGATCICFMGGDSAPEEIAELAREVKREFPALKTAVYSGNSTLPAALDAFDYVKIGAWNAELGTLKDRTTNQRLYAVRGGKTEDITAKFWKK